MNYIDTRDLLQELDALCDRRDDEEQTDALTDDETARLAELVRLRDEIGGEFDYGVTMIPESDFVTYAQELAEDIGAINSDAAWPATCIDWEQAANQLRADYTSVEFDGTTWLARA